MGYWALVMKDAAKVWRASLRAERERSVRLVATYAVLFIVFLIVDISLIDQQKLSQPVAAGLAAVPGVLLLVFVWSFITAPGRLHAELRDGMEKRDKVIREIVDTEAELQRLDDLYREGRTLYDRPGLDPNQWIADMATWSARVDEEIKRQYSVSLRFKYKTWVLEGFTITIKASGLQLRAWAIPKSISRRDWSRLSGRSRMAVCASSARSRS